MSPGLSNVFLNFGSILLEVQKKKLKRLWNLLFNGPKDIIYV